MTTTTETNTQQNASEVLASLLAQMKGEESKCQTMRFGINVGLLRSILENRGERQRVAAVRGEFFSSQEVPLIYKGKTQDAIKSQQWLEKQAEQALELGGVLQVTVVMDFRCLAGILKSALKANASYISIGIQSVEGIHQRLVKNREDNIVTALSVDMFDSDLEHIEVKPASNPLNASAFYADDDATWEAAILNSVTKQVTGFKKWKSENVSQTSTQGATLPPKPEAGQADQADDEEEEEEYTAPDSDSVPA